VAVEDFSIVRAVLQGYLPGFRLNGGHQTRLTEEGRIKGEERRKQSVNWKPASMKRCEYGLRIVARARQDLEGIYR